MAPDADTLLRHAGGIRALLRGLLADDARIDDVLQDTWVVALAKGPREGVPLGPWLKRVALNFARKLHRGESRRAARERAAARPDATPEARFDLQREVVDELARLGEPYRSTLILHFFEGLSPKEIAEERGIPAATVRSHLKRGLDRIRERLDKEHGSRGGWGAVFLPWLATRRAAATGVIAMSVKTKLTLVAALVLAMAGGTTVVWRASRRVPGPPARTSLETLPPAAAAPAAAEEGRVRVAERDRTLLIRGRIIDAATGRIVPHTRLRIVFASDERPLDLVTDEGGRFSGTAPVVPGGVLAMPGPSVARGVAVAVEGYALLRAPDAAKPEGDVFDLGDLEVVRGVPVAGRVVRHDGTGVADARLLLSFQGYFPPASAFPVGRSGPDGSYVLERVLITPGQLRWTLLALCDEGLGVRALEVLEGRERLDGVEVVVDPAAPVEVRVIDDVGLPLDADVRCEPRFQPLHPFPYASGHTHSLWTGPRAGVCAIFNAHTDAKGRVVFARLPLPGPYDVVAGAKGYVLGWQDDVAVDRERRRVVTLRLASKRLCAFTGIVLGTDGTPIAGATVSVREGLGTTTDAAGRFRLERLEPAWGKVTLVTEAAGHARSSRDMRIPADRDVEGIELRLERSTPIAGRVVDQEGRPVAGVYLDLLRTREQLRPDVDRTGEDGRFVFRDATAGPWKLRVVGALGEPDLERYLEVEVSGGDTGLEIVLRRHRLGTTRLVASVVDAATGERLDPADAMLIRLDRRGPTEYASPTPARRRSGEVTADRLHPARWRLWVHVLGYAPAHVDFTVRAGQAEARVEVRMGPAGRIVGRVVGISAKSTVWTHPPGPDLAPGMNFETSGRIRGWARVQEDGTFVVENLAPGPTIVKLAAGGFLGEATVDVPSGGEAQAEIVATRAAVLAFRSAERVPAGTEAVEFYVAQADEWELKMRLGGEAKKLLDEHETLPAGRTRWRVVFDSDGRVRTQEGVVDLVVGQTTEVVVPIELERR